MTDEDRLKAKMKELKEKYAGAPYSGSTMRFAELTGRPAADIAHQMLYRTGKMSLAAELGTAPQHGPYWALLGEANPYKVRRLMV